MKLLTCNTHSLVEDRYEEKLNQFVEKVLEEKFDVIALQEVNQTHGGVYYDIKYPEYYVGADDFQGEEDTDTKEEILITSDNHMMRAAEMLHERGLSYYWTWVPIKLGYDRYDEGIGVFTREKPEAVKHFYISDSKDYGNWHSRKVIGVKLSGCWYYSMHMGWWQEEGESFHAQWERFLANLPHGENIYLMGDFNNPAHIDGEGYSLVRNSGFYDTYHLAGQKDDGMTVVKVIDGWRDKNKVDRMRIDFIFKNNSDSVVSSQVIFNGENGPVISDHFGIVVEL